MFWLLLAIIRRQSQHCKEILYMHDKHRVFNIVSKMFVISFMVSVLN
jgi:hypothetical protein